MYKKIRPLLVCGIYDCQTMGFVPDLNSKEYVDTLKARMKDRVDFVKSCDTAKEGYDKLPEEAAAAIQKVCDELATI